jgi:nitrate/nitrite transport system permease protein
MGAPALKPTAEVRPLRPGVASPASPEVVKLPARKPASRFKTFGGRMKSIAATIVPPLLVVAAILLVWQIAFGRPGATLPPPTTIWTEAKDLIIDPFFVNGSQDIGLGWRVLTSLERVLYGFGLAAVVGVLLGALVGQSVWAMRGLDPIFQVLRTVPPLAWLPILRRSS